MGIKDRGGGGGVGGGSTGIGAFSIGIYQPPAVRKASHLGENSSASGLASTNSLESPKSVDSLPLSNAAQSSNDETLTRDAQQLEEPLNNQRPRQRRPDRAVYVPRGRRSQTTPPLSATSNSASQSAKLPIHTKTIETHSTNNAQLISDSNIQTTTIHHNQNNTDNRYSGVDSHQLLISVEDSVKTNCDYGIAHCNTASLSDRDRNLDTAASALSEQLTTMSKLKTNIKQQCNIKSNDVTPETRDSDKDYNEEKEFQRASKEINRSNRRIIKQTFNSDVLEIIPNTKDDSNVDVPKRATKQINNDGETEEDDWESMFDDNGECLDPKVIEEVTAAVGKVAITKPKSDYRIYKTTSVNLDAEEFPHVLEVSNFPIEFKTQDLMMLFSQYKESGFDIKWVDDTHALAVFSSSKVATDVLNMGHPFVRLKPLTQATVESRAKAKKCSLSLQPYRQRPETCAALARRLVTGALGVRLSTAREELENERRVLREAKERKLLAAKLRDEAWES